MAGNVPSIVWAEPATANTFVRTKNQLTARRRMACCCITPSTSLRYVCASGEIASSGRTSGPVPGKTPSHAVRTPRVASARQTRDDARRVRNDMRGGREDTRDDGSGVYPRAE